VPAAAVIPALIAYIKVVAVKKLVVGSWSVVGSVRPFGCALAGPFFPTGHSLLLLTEWEYPPSRLSPSPVLPSGGARGVWPAGAGGSSGSASGRVVFPGSRKGGGSGPSLALLPPPSSRAVSKPSSGGGGVGELGRSSPSSFPLGGGSSLGPDRSASSFTLNKLECSTQAVPALNTLAWDNRIGLWFYFVGF